MFFDLIGLICTTIGAIVLCASAYCIGGALWSMVRYHWLDEWLRRWRP